MLRFAWRWAKVGDQVLVHDREDLKRDLMSGEVAIVKRVDGETSIGVRVERDGASHWVWPTPLFVHPDPLDPEEPCWICEENLIVEKVEVT